MSQSRSRTKSILKWVAVAAAAAIAVIVLKQLNVFAWINDVLTNVLTWVENLGFWGPVIFVGIYILSAVFLLSGAVLTLGAGVLFGVIKGSIIVSIAATLGATAAFLVGRYIARDWVSQQIEERPKFKAIDSAVAREGWKIVGLTRLSPIFPYVFLNYAFGVTKVKLRDYFFASWIGMLPGTVMYVYLGSLAGNLATISESGGGESPVLQWTIRIVGFIATVAVTLYVTKIARSALDSEIQAERTEEKTPSNREDEYTSA